MKLTKYSLYTALVIFPLVFGCAPSKNSLVPKQMPDTYGTGAMTDSSTLAMVHWNEFFEDESLRSLIQAGLENNQDVLKTLYAIRRAQAGLRQAKAGRLPELNAYAGAGVRRFGEYTMDGVGNTDSNLSPTVPEDKKIPDPYRDFTIGLDFNWEIDVWGRLSMLKRQALARYMESEDMYNLARTNLIATIAETYYLAAGLTEQIRILEENIEIQLQQFELGKSLKETGQDSQLSLDQFEGLLLNSRGLLLEKRKQLQHAKLMLMELTASTELDLELEYLYGEDLVPEVVKAGIPSDLLTYRPDVRAAARNLEAQNLQASIARTAYFPTFNLSAMAGFNTFEFGRLFQTPASAVYQLGGGLAAPIFNRNRINAYYQTAKADQQVALLDYEQTALKSYLEILRLVNDFEFIGEQITLKREEVAIQKRSIDNAITMFRIGYADYLDVINSQSRSLESELSYVELRIGKLQNFSNLYRALGGGWQ